MKLPLTSKYFPKTLALIKKLPTKDLSKLIQTYSLDGIKVFSPKENKIKNILPNSVDSKRPEERLINAVKVFNGRLTTKDPITVFYHAGSALIDHDLYGKLDDFITNHYPDMPKGVNKYLKKDDMIADKIKSGELKGFTIKSHGYTVIDLYMPRDFNFTIPQLLDIVEAYCDNDQKFKKEHVTTKVKEELHQDGVTFNKIVEPMLYLLMKNPSEYRKVLKHKRLLYAISVYART